RYKRSVGGVTNLRTLFDWPIGRQGIYHCANIRRGRRPRKSEGSRLEERNCNKYRPIVPKTIVGAQPAIQAGTRSPSPRARKRCVEKFNGKISRMAVATLARTPRREKPTPSGAAMSVTTKQVQGSAIR